jgi:hypothetical protein
MITVEEATEQVKLLARRMALMYHHIGVVLTEAVGKDRAKELMKEAIWRYGTECGEVVRKGVEERGLPLTAQNFNVAPDLPKYGWDRELVFEEGEARPKVNYCPLAEVWIEKGSAEMGRLYCFVDQAKFRAYNDLECVHIKDLLDGDPYCLLSIHEKLENVIVARVHRFDPAHDKEGRLQEFRLPAEAPLSVMSIMARVHDTDPSFACRTSMCYHGTCGSCWVRVNGKNVKGCMALVKPGETVTIEPHSGYRLLRDVVVDFASPTGSEEEEEVEPDESR